MTPGQYVMAALAKPWVWFEHDCCRFIDGWVVHRGRESPMDLLGIHYDSETSALRRIREGGGLVRLWSAGMALAGVPEVDEPTPGDVGIVPVSTEDGLNEACGIYLGPRWAMLGVRGLYCATVVPLRAWRP